MRLKAILGLGLAAAMVVLGTGPAHASATTQAPPVPAPPAARPAGGTPRTITLITGDRLTVAAGDRVAVQRGPGRGSVTFLSRTVRGHLEVIPSDALPLLAAGTLDARLFDVTTLLQFGYDDRRASLPLIVTYDGGAAGRTAARAMLGRAAGRDLPAVNGVAVTEPRATATAFWAGLTGGTPRAATRTLSGHVAKVWLDGIRKPLDDVSNAQIGAPTAWQAGFTGTGAAVAVVDTGIDATHPDLAGKVLAEQNFTDDGDALDHVGHGTHVAATIAGTGAASGGRYKGVAPDAKLYDAKVCVLNGCLDSWILAGMQWAAADQHAKVVNMSLGGPDSPGLDPLEQAVENLTAQYGTLFVIAAGNDGQDGSVESPGTADDALSVGAVDSTDALAVFSSRGPRVGDGAIKPEITAPGVDIVSARGKDGIFGNPGDLYTTLSGTSMATPHVAGSAAILAGEHPDWTPAQLKAALMAAAKPNPTIGVYGQGAGRVDIGRGISQSVTTSPASVSFPFSPWPHTGDKPVTRTVSYHNGGTSAVTLTLALHTSDQSGKPTPDGLFTLSASQVTVPAGGDASVDVTVDTRVGPDGFLGGQLTATGGATVVQTPIAVDKEVESYDVTVTTLDRTGAPASLYDSVLVRLDGVGEFDAFDPSGTQKLRVPKGQYLLFSFVLTGDPTSPDVSDSLLVQPVLTVSSAQQVTLDARAAKPVSVSIPRQGATQLVANVGFSQKIGEAGFTALLVGDTFANLYSAQVGPAGSTSGLTGFVSGTWGQIAADGSIRNSPYAYSLAYFRDGRMFDGLQRTVKQQDLATVRVDMAHEATGATGTMVAFGTQPDNPSANGFAVGFPGDLPGSRTEYFNDDGGVRWQSLFDQEVPGTDPQDPFPNQISFTQSLPIPYRHGHSYHETWNQGVAGPVFPPRPAPQTWVTRTGDTLNLFPPTYGDNAGREGYALTASEKSTVTRDGVQIGTQNQVFSQYTLPPAPGTYRVQLDYSRGAPFTLSTRTSIAWTFTSAHVTGDTPQPLPVSVVRFLPDLDLQNTAAGGVCVLPVRVDRQPDAARGHTSGLTVQVSYDDGAHWAPVPVLRHDDAALALLRHPAGHGFVSLRASAVDTAGNTVDEEIIRAYAF